MFRFGSSLKRTDLTEILESEALQQRRRRAGSFVLYIAPGGPLRRPHTQLPPTPTLLPITPRVSSKQEEFFKVVLDHSSLPQRLNHLTALRILNRGPTPARLSTNHARSDRDLAPRALARSLGVSRPLHVASLIRKPVARGGRHN